MDQGTTRDVDDNNDDNDDVTAAANGQHSDTCTDTVANTASDGAHWTKTAVKSYDDNSSSNSLRGDAIEDTQELEVGRRYYDSEGALCQFAEKGPFF
ncbi:hypothetical protein ACOMHN_043624 [Nucella lapillus]